eukprot:TRINITY_DN6972_c0_g1_i1.p1 TRINITY_DN6972_c0_g1~~TRINITY_DN6972_c0_g1_i1.p1  ORF type:complete len:429 (+),score=50.46 TRINITY_DN6972_c0_g1_i1:231-1517(+)
MVNALASIPLLGSCEGAVDEIAEHSATMTCGDGVAQDVTKAPPLDEDDVVFELMWELGMERVTVRRGSVVHEQSVATEKSLAKTTEFVRMVPLGMLRGVGCETVKTKFYNGAAQKLIYGAMFVLSFCLLILGLVKVIGWWMTDSAYINSPGMATLACIVLFIAFFVCVGSVVGYTSNSSRAFVYIALPLETSAMRAYSGVWLPRSAVAVFHTLAILACTFGGAFNTRSVPFGLAPWFSLSALVALVATFCHGRTRRVGTWIRNAFGGALLGLTACVAMGFAATFVGIGTAECETTKPEGWFCGEVETECNTTKLAMCEGPVSDVVFGYFILLLVSYVPVGIFVYSVEEVGYTARCSADAATDKPMLVTLRGPQAFGYPLEMHMQSSQVKHFLAEVAKRQFTGRYTEAALAMLPVLEFGHAFASGKCAT